MDINDRYKEEASGVLKQISDDRLLNDAYKEIDDSTLTLWAYDKKQEVIHNQCYCNSFLTVISCCVFSRLRMVVTAVLLLHDVTTLLSLTMN